MKSIKLFVALLLISVMGMGQVPQKIAYQAVLRNADGTVIADENVDLKINFRVESLNGNVVYAETHNVDVNKQGIVSIILGDGNPVSGSFVDIPWDSEVFIEILVKTQSQNDFISLGTSQLVSVPYALMAKNGVSTIGEPGQTTYSNGDTWIASSRISVSDSSVNIAPGANHDPEKPIFTVTNSQGQVVMAVYESGVRFYVEEEGAKGAKGGFAVGGLSTTKASPDYYFSVNPSNTSIYFNNSVKGAKGGFAVGGLSTTKSDTAIYLTVKPEETNVFFENSNIKGAKGGFAVGGLSTGKSLLPGYYFQVLPDSTYVANTMVSYGNMMVAGDVLTSVGVADAPLTDFDGNTYKTVKIGQQVWMAENLRTSSYFDGTPIDPATYYKLTKPDSTIVFGHMYLVSAISAKNVCPTGWHVPTIEDWSALFTFVGGPEYVTNSAVLFKKLSEPYKDVLNGIYNWDPVSDPVTYATNETGFSARGAGVIIRSAATSSWYGQEVGMNAYFWVNPSGQTSYVVFNSSLGSVDVQNVISIDPAYPVRSVKDN
ncbi:MAG: hypothetical protein PWR03_230 [Tenuifilum sp.]|jgi:uncharacterized protein (TIGR02145 family)|uniref:fibrobacter succinogenes major paralogous domain-containing protein n=1 Tax=Tenuifilum sp. TaxID=2760880 RepID=UPI0024AB675B|nr:fibrobacter succinogenes major paralogous domain-containing protein [Tenuifilum sp.]MDI3526047.1 hypothetical protein [Tenuifilum sp.]